MIMMSDSANSGPVELVSAVSFASTLDRLLQAIERAGMNLFATIDHAAGARNIGLVMPPTVVLIYGHARGGTPIMLATPQAALDLPLRVLVREDADGRTLVSFHPAAPMLRRAGVPETLATRLEPVQRILAEAVAAAKEE
jgi:uncharacterized protein (DUF302 family)